MSKKLLLSFFLLYALSGFAQPGFTCAEAISIGALPYNTTDNTANYADTSDAYWFTEGNDVFYSYTPPATGTYSVIMDPTDEHSSIWIFSSCANMMGTTVVSMGTSGDNPRIFPALNLTGGITYYIFISTDSNLQTVGYSLSIEKRNCTYPTQLSVTSVGATTADLSWNNPASTSNFEVFIQPQGMGMPTGSGVTAIGTTYNATNLNDDTDYEYWVRSVCSDGTFSFWGGPKTFKTEIDNGQCLAANQCDYIFHLVDIFGDGWNGNSMSVQQNGIVITAAMGLDTPNGSEKYVTVPLCHDQPFELFWNAGGLFPSEVIVEITNPFGQLIYQKPDGVGSQNSLLFQATANCSGPICVAPSNVRFTDLSAGSISVTWTELGTATQWEVLVLPIGSPAPTAAATGGIVATTNPFLIIGLIDGSEYDVYVRAICADNFKSDWTLPATAMATCPAPVVFNDFGGDFSTSFSWNAGLSSQWEVIVQPIGLPAPDVSVHGVIVNAPQYTLDSTVEGIFDVYVRAICSFSNSNWSTPYQVEISCAQVSDVTVSENILSWTSNGSATQWEIWVYEGNVSSAGGGNHETYIASGNPFVVPDMAVGEDYSIYVRGVCGADDSSVWSTQRYFIYTGLGNPEVRSEDFVLYPNPAKGSVNVSIAQTDAIDSIRLYDMIGKLVNKTSGVSASQATLDVSALSKGVYLIEVTTKSQLRLTKKLIIQ